MTTAVTTIDEFNKTTMEVESTRKMCDLLMKTPHYAKMGNDGVFAVISKAKSLNMDPIYALNGGLYYLQGKVGMPAESMSALIREKGHSIVKDSKSNDQICILHGKRADNGDTWTCSFSMEDARRAGLVKHSYEKYPAAMLYNRAMSFLARQLFSDIIKGAGYTFEELKEIASSKPQFGTYEVEEKSIDVITITKEEAEDLDNTLLACSEDYQKNFWAFLKKKVPDIEENGLEKLPISMYERIKNAIHKKREEHQRFLMEGETEEPTHQTLLNPQNVMTLEGVINA